MNNPQGRISALRFQALDAWRGIAAVMVVFFHMPIAWSLYSEGIFRHSWLFVDFFFVLSGFVIAFAYGNRINDGRGFADFMIRRFGRVWPLHTAVLVALVLLQIVVFALTRYAHFPAPNSKPFEGQWSAWAIPANLILVHSLGLMPGPGTWNTPSWSISVEFYTYVVFGLAVVIFRRRLIVLSAILSIGGLLALALLSNAYLGTTTQWGFARCLYGFFLGVIIFHIEARLPKPTVALATGAEFILTIAVVAFVWLVGPSALSFLAPQLFAVVVLVFAKEAGLVSRALKTRPFLWLGEHSYTIYMIHLSIFILLNYATRTAERLLHRPLTTVTEGFDSLNLVTDRTIMDFGSAQLNNLTASIVLAAIVVIAAVAYRNLELPARDFFYRKVRDLSANPITKSMSSAIASIDP